MKPKDNNGNLVVWSRDFAIERRQKQIDSMIKRDGMNQDFKTIQQDQSVRTLNRNNSARDNLQTLQVNKQNEMSKVDPPSQFESKSRAGYGTLSNQSHKRSKKKITSSSKKEIRPIQ